MGKYEPLKAFLSARKSDELEISFAELESIVGPLPKSARASREWWAAESAVQALAWRSAGWSVSSVDQSKEIVIFVRGQGGMLNRHGLTPQRLGDEDPQVTEAQATPAASEREKRAAEPDHGDTEKARILPAVIAAAVSIAGGAVATAVGLAALPRWAILLISLDLSIVSTLIALAIGKAKYRVLTLWASNCTLILLVAGTAIYNLVPQESVTANFVPKSDVTLSTVAGGAPDKTNPNGIVLPSGTDETATCYSHVNGMTWLYFHISDESYGWAPLSEFRYDPGFSSRLPSACP